MAINATHWSIDRTLKDIRYIGPDHGPTASYATVIEFHRWLQDLADDATFVGDDEMDITDLTPSDRSTDNIITLINGYNINDTASEHLYDGSIIQNGGNDIYDGIVNFGNTPKIQLIQNGAVVADDWWNEDPFSAGLGINSAAASGISHRFMVKTVTGGADVDGRRLIGTSRNFGKTYSEFSINGTSRGNNVLALSESDDLNNTTAESTVAGWTTIVNTTEGYAAIDVNNDGANEHYYSEWDKAAFSINQFYERMKWLTRDSSGSTIYGLNGENFRGITTEIDYTALAGTIDESNPVTFSNGATAQVLADDGVGTVWVQLLTGVQPTGSDTILQSAPDSASAAVSVVTDRSGTISTPFVGQSTGSAIIGAYGVGLERLDLTASDTLFALENPAAAINPPNNVTFTVFGVAGGEDRVLVGPATGSSLLTAQYSLNGTLSTDNVGSFIINELIDSDAPATGTVRLQDDNGLYRRLSYASYTGYTFTLNDSSGNEDFAGTNATTGNEVFVSYIDTLAADSDEAFTSVFKSTRQLFVRVRDGGVTPIKTFETTGTLGSAGGSTTAIRTSDE
jgi:hypothetical protein